MEGVADRQHGQIHRSPCRNRNAVGLHRTATRRRPAVAPKGRARRVRPRTRRGMEEKAPNSAGAAPMTISGQEGATSGDRGGASSAPSTSSGTTSLARSRLSALRWHTGAWPAYASFGISQPPCDTGTRTTRKAPARRSRDPVRNVIARRGRDRQNCDYNSSAYPETLDYRLGQPRPRHHP